VDVRSPALEGFRQEVREFCKARLPPDIRAKVLANRPLDKSDHVRWQKILAENGWFTGHWPVAEGGLGWTPLQRWVFESEAYRQGAPWLIPFGATYVAPVLYTFGSEAQRRRHLPAIRSSDCWWAQGYSEPGAGSDLAAVSTRAERDGDDWIVTGVKLWTTMAQWADMMFALVRTSAADRPQNGLSFLLIDLRSPGVSIRPIRTIDQHHHVNEVVLDQVRVSGADLVGEPGQGWTYAKFLLGHERLVGADVGRCSRKLEDLRALSLAVGSAGRPLARDAAWRRRIASIQARLMGLESLAASMLTQHQSGGDPGARASVLKLLWSEISQDIDGAAMDALGHAGLPYPVETLSPDWAGAAGPSHAAGFAREYLHGRALTIYGGSSEIQRNIIAKAVLGL
jgi:alkylation response protein AidB-like acyl-CoA dehydrogenase